jgi:hypothetical protein
MVASGEQPLRMCAAHAKFGNGFCVAPVPAELFPEPVEAACRVEERTRIPEKRKKSCPPVMIAFALII